jgi:type II secretory pathway pseudopilin PulG
MIAVVILGTLIAGAFPLLFTNLFRRAQADQAESAQRIVIDVQSVSGSVRIAGSHVESIGEAPSAITH